MIMPATDFCGLGGGPGGRADAVGIGSAWVPAIPPDGTGGSHEGGGGGVATNRTGGAGGGGGGAATNGAGGRSGGGRVAATGGCTASRRGFPHLTQNFIPSGIEAPHERQFRPAAPVGGVGAGAMSGLPQDVQNFSPGEFSLPQFAHATMVLFLRLQIMAPFCPISRQRMVNGCSTGKWRQTRRSRLLWGSLASCGRLSIGPLPHFGAAAQAASLMPHAFCVAGVRINCGAANLAVAFLRGLFRRGLPGR
jgi:hypothetical protein